MLERILGEATEPDFHDGFGSLSDDQADAIRELREHGKQTSKEHMQRLASDGDEPESGETQ